MAVWSPSVVTVAFGLFLVINSVASQGKKPFISWACYYESFFKLVCETRPVFERT